MNQRRAIVALLTVIAAALVMNVVVKGTQVAVAQTAAGPVEPTVVGGAFQNSGGTGWRTVRFWSDGHVDMKYTVLEGACGIVSECEVALWPGSCTADITRDGSVEIGDMLGVLGEWGPCE